MPEICHYYDKLKWSTAAHALDDYRLHLTFNDGSIDIVPKHLNEQGMAA